MAKIEWTDRTWNPVRGCTRISDGCRNCYAERIAARFSHRPGYASYEEGGGLESPGGVFHGFAKMTPNSASWTGRVELIESKLYEPMTWRKPCRVFVNSMSDLFHERLPDEAIDRVFAIMALCPHLRFQVLTKRASRMSEWANSLTAAARVKRCMWEIMDRQGWRPAFIDHEISENGGFPLPNVWLGVSVENQAAADERIPLLVQTPAAVRFISAEPLLGPVDLLCGQPTPPRIDWVICGGESGPGARPMQPQWARSLRDQCVGAKVPFFFKQWGEWQPAHFQERDAEGMRRVGKAAAGRLLDGREWKQCPEVAR